MFEKQLFGEKARKYGEAAKRRIPYQFSKLFQSIEISLPSDLEKLISNDKGIMEIDLNRNCTNKIRVILKINETKEAPSCLTLHKNQNCIGLIDPTPSRKTLTSNNNVNMFPFDSIFTENDQKASLLSSSLIDPISSFFQGKDACIFSFGNHGLGKTKTMIGSDQSQTEIGIIPCAMVWIFTILEQLKTNPTTRYSIRISALEISNRNLVRDLLINTNAYNNNTPGSSADNRSSPDEGGAHIGGLLINKHTEVPAIDLHSAARIIDGVLAARSTDREWLTHLQLVIHLYQHKIDTTTTTRSTGGEVVTKHVLSGRSRLQLLDLGSGRQGTDDSGTLSLQGMSKVILALYTSQRHIPYKDNALTQLLRECLGGVNTVTTMLVHVSNKEQNYNDTLQIVQLASKLYRTRSRKSRSVGFMPSNDTSSFSSSSSGFDGRRPRPHMGIGATRRSSGNSSASSELDMTSASELSCCETVIFRGGSDPVNPKKSLHASPISATTYRMSSESDINSDKECPIDYTSCSSHILSPTTIRRRRISPRTNARVWPSSNHTINPTIDNGPEMWVDGPNAVYKGNQSKLAPHDADICNTPAPINKPLMISKETQCDDVWDSSSSVTDGSSHSNTLDGKECRPLSDISECTEDTESNLGTETELVGVDNMNGSCPVIELDDLLESTLGLSQYPENLKQRQSIHKPNYVYNMAVVMTKSQVTLEIDSMTNQNNTESIKSFTNSHSNNTENLNENQKTMKSSESLKPCQSENIRRKTAKTERKQRKSKSKSQKFPKRINDKHSKSVSSSISTDFSRVKRWIQSVDNEIQASGNDHESKEFFLQDPKSHDPVHNQSGADQCMVSIPDVASFLKPYQSIRSDTDFDQVRYSLYGGFQMFPGPSMRDSDPRVQSPPPQLIGPPSHSSSGALIHTNHDYANPSNISCLHRTTTNAQSPMLPLLPHRHPIDPTCLRNQGHIHLPFLDRQMRSEPTHIKSVTLPRDVYSDFGYNKQTQFMQYKDGSEAVLQDNKSKDKHKKVSKNILSLILAPFTSIRNKMARSKCHLEHGLARESPQPLASEWPMLCPLKINPGFTLPSPYHLVTDHKTGRLPTGSSGHGSDSSSQHQMMSGRGRPTDPLKYNDVRNRSMGPKGGTHQRPTSSGYGSIIIKGDSEVSSHNDSSSEYSISGPRISHNTQSKIRHSVSLSNCKSFIDSSTNSTMQNGNNSSKIGTLSVAEDLMFRENLRMALNQERKIVIEYIEINKLKGIPADASVMNLMCFKCIDSVAISKPTNHEQCQSVIQQIYQETEQLKQKLYQAQKNLVLVTAFDSNTH